MNTFEGSRECGGVMVSKERDDTSMLNYQILKLWLRGKGWMST